MKILIYSYISRYKMHKFVVPIGQKAIKKTSSGLTGKFTFKKIQILFGSCLFTFFFAFKSLRV